MNEIRSHDYVNHPYAAVHDRLVKDPAAVLSAATNAAAARARDVAAALHVNIGPLDIGAEIAVTVGEISEQSYTAPISRVTRIPIEWSAAQRPSAVSGHESRIVGLSAHGNGDPARLSWDATSRRWESSAVRSMRRWGTASPRRRSIASLQTSRSICANT